MVKYRFFINNISKEEEWLEKYRQQGYRLKSVQTLTGRYEFEKVNEQEFLSKVKIDYRMFGKEDDFKDYIAMFEDSGWKHIAGTKSNGVQYFAQSSEDVDDDIFSDNESKAGRYKRLSDMWLELFVCYVPIAICLQIQGAGDLSKLFHLKELYYTPGLWEMKGAAFWMAFLFETPFALGRGGIMGLLFWGIVLLYAWFGVKALYWYRKERE